MKLKNIEDLVGQAGEFAEQIGELEGERNQLTQKIPSLTAKVAAGDTKAVNNLAIAKARQEVLPAELENLKRERLACISQLNAEFSGLYVVLGRAYSDEYQRVQTAVKEFLGQHLDDGHVIQETARQVANDCKSVRKLDALRGQFSGLMTGGRPDPESVLSRAQFALKEL